MEQEQFEHFEQERRIQPYCNTQAVVNWDAKSFISLASLAVLIIGGLFASWMSLSGQITTINVTQQLKFAQIDEQIKTITIDQNHIHGQMDSLEGSIQSILSNQYKPQSLQQITPQRR